VRIWLRQESRQDSWHHLAYGSDSMFPGGCISRASGSLTSFLSKAPRSGSFIQRIKPSLTSLLSKAPTKKAPRSQEPYTSYSTLPALSGLGSAQVRVWRLRPRVDGQRLPPVRGHTTGVARPLLPIVSVTVMRCGGGTRGKSMSEISKTFLTPAPCSRELSGRTRMNTC
jgi:hypothetical protein